MTSHSFCLVRRVRTILTAATIAAVPLLLGLAGPAAAQQAIYAPGEPIVTGFSGVAPPGSPPTTGDPLDYTFIDPNGSSMVIQQLQPNGPPAGQLIPSPPAFSAKAQDVGQVFGIALDDAPDVSGAAAPNIYLTATSAYGLDIVVPDASGNPVRSKVGAAGATFMPGQWGAAGGAVGSPGSIWKVDGTTGQISLFTTIAANSGAGLGDIVFDPSTQQFFVSDLDTGLIYRLDSTGAILDTFDHGVAGRPNHALPAVADDGSEMDITKPAFNSEDPTTWGFTQPERKVNGLAVHDGRLYYAVAAGPQIWSVGINLDGTFANDARWELDVTGLPSTNEVTNIVFDGADRMILAQRGPQVGSYDYSVFAEPKTSSVVRYTRELPDDPSTPSIWVETPDTYAIGFRPAGENASGGIALGYGYDPGTQSIGGACSAFLWSTGDSLRDASAITPALTPPLDPPAQVHGLQGNDEQMVRPQNDPPLSSYFTDYDGNTGDDQAPLQGHVGDVAIWQNCQGTPGSGYGYAPPPPPPGYLPPPHFNLTLTKTATPKFCNDFGGNWFCGFDIRVKNTGPVPYWGPVTVNDWLPDNNPGAMMKFGFQPPWSCLKTGSTAYQCVTGPALLYPGDSIDLHEVVKLPHPTNDKLCFLDNDASLVWAFGHDDNPGDDFDSATALINSVQCLPPPVRQKTDLRLQKIAFPTTCQDGGSEWLCDFYIRVTNMGPGNFSGPIKVTDTLGTNVTASFAGPWACSQSGVNITCNISSPPVNVAPGWHSTFEVVAHVKKATDGQPLCRLSNVADIASPLGGPADPLNFNAANDHGSAVVTIPDRRCDTTPQRSDLRITKRLESCVATPAGTVAGYTCSWLVSVSNAGPATYVGPLSIEDASPQATGNSLLSSPLCSGSPTDVTCTNSSPGVSMPVGNTISVLVKTSYPNSRDVCAVRNTASILQPVPGTAQNTGAPDVAVANGTLPNPDCSPVRILTEQCPTAQVAPVTADDPSGCCPSGTTWNGRICAPPKQRLKPPVSSGPTDRSARLTASPAPAVVVSAIPIRTGIPAAACRT